MSIPGREWANRDRARRPPEARAPGRPDLGPLGRRLRVLPARDRLGQATRQPGPIVSGCVPVRASAADDGRAGAAMRAGRARDDAGRPAAPGRPGQPLHHGPGRLAAFRRAVVEPTPALAGRAGLPLRRVESRLAVAALLPRVAGPGCPAQARAKFSMIQPAME